MLVRDTARSYGTEKTSPSVRTLDEVKNELDRCKRSIKVLEEGIEDHKTGWADDTEGLDRLERKLESAQSDRTRLEKELRSHPDYYADKYQNYSRLDKAATGILGSTLATVPVIVRTTVDAKKEAEAKMESESYAAALQAEKTAWNKLNDYAASYIGSFDMIDQSELDRLNRNYQQASADRKRIGAQYEQPVDMDSWGMRKMAESSWLKNSATEGMSGTGKTLADTAIDIGQGAALLPLMAGGAGIYTAGVAANAAAEDMYEQTAKGRSANAALSSGAMTAGMEVIGSKFGDIKGADTKITVKAVYNALRSRDIASVQNFGRQLCEKTGFEFTREGALYLMDYLADKAIQNPNEEFTLTAFAQSAILHKISGFAEKSTDSLLKELNKAWKHFD